MCPTTTANAHNPSIPPIGGEGRLHDSAGPPIFPSLNRVRGAGVEPASQAWKAGVITLDYPPAATGHLGRGLGAFPHGCFVTERVLRMFRPALICRSISQSHIKQTNTLPTRSRRRAPHTGQVLLVHAGFTLITGTPARAALYSI